jgi:hypothetical protein
VDASTIIALVVGIIGTGGITSVIGFALGGRNERKKDERALQARQNEAARTFQRDTLLEIHDLLYKLNRNAGKSGHIDEMQYRESGKFARQQLPDDLSDQFTELLTGVRKLKVRIFDPELRSKIEEYLDVVVRATGTGVRQPGDDDDVHARAKSMEAKAMEAYGPLEEAIGVAIRMQFVGSGEHPTPGLTFRTVLPIEPHPTADTLSAPQAP